MKRSPANRILAVFLAVLTVFGAFAFTAAYPTADAATINGRTVVWNDDLKWSLSSTGTLTVSGTGAIPENMPVTLTDNPTALPWEASKSKIKKIVVKKGVTELGCGCFRDMKNLTSVSLPSSLKTIDGYVFMNDTKLKTISIPSSVEYVDSFSFYLSGIENNSTYRKNEKLVIGDWLILVDPASPETKTKFTLSEAKIANGALSYLSALEQITIGAAVKHICDPQHLTSAPVKNYKVSSSNKNYSSDSKGVLYTKYKTVLLAYPSGKTAESFTVPSTVTTIGENAFFGAKLRSVKLPSKLTTIRNSAFCWCDNLSSAALPSGVTKIEAWAFAGTSLKTVTVPASVKTIGENAFGAYTLTKISVSSSSKNYSSKDGILFNKSKTTLICCPQAKQLTSYTVPKTVKKIGPFAFTGCTKLASVTLNSGLTSIGEEAFSDTGLKKVVMPSTVTSLGSRAFANCPLASVTLSKNLKSIPTACFIRCDALTSITIPASVTAIRSSAFYWSGLKSIKIPDTVKTIGSSAFAGCMKLASVTLPKKLTSISSSLFANCSSLTSVTIPPTVTYIGDYAFAYSGIVTLKIPASVKTVGTEALPGSWDSNCKAVYIYNKSCKIRENTLMESAVVYGYKGSTAQTFAKNNGYKFKAL